MHLEADATGRIYKDGSQVQCGRFNNAGVAAEVARVYNASHTSRPVVADTDTPDAALAFAIAHYSAEGRKALDAGDVGKAAAMLALADKINTVRDLVAHTESLRAKL